MKRAPISVLKFSLLLASLLLFPVFFCSAESEGGHRPYGPNGPEGALSDVELTDHKAQVFSVRGEVKILKAGEDDWKPVEKGMVIGAGDQIVTPEGGDVEIAYDSQFMNIAKISEKTKAEFLTIEPTDLRMEDGTIFSALDGLAAGTSYQISTPTAVAAVRGTHLFTEAAAGAFANVAVTPDQKPELSLVEVTVEGGGSFEVNEGQQLSFEGETPKIGEIDPVILQEAGNAVAEVRDNPEAQAPQGMEDGEKPAGEQSAEEKPADKTDDNQKNTGTPPPGGGGGGDNGNGGGGSQDGGTPAGGGGLLSTSMEAPGEAAPAPTTEVAPTQPVATVDAMMDSLVPPADFESYSGSAPVEGGEKSAGGGTTLAKSSGSATADSTTSEDGTTDSQVTGASAPKTPTSGQYKGDAIMNFLAIGTQGGSSGGAPMTGEGFTKMTDTVMGNLGVSPEMSKAMGEIFKVVAPRDGGASPLNLGGGPIGGGPLLMPTPGGPAIPIAGIGPGIGGLPFGGQMKLDGIFDTFRLNSNDIAQTAAQTIAADAVKIIANNAVPHNNFYFDVFTNLRTVFMNNNSDLISAFDSIAADAYGIKELAWKDVDVDPNTQADFTTATGYATLVQEIIPAAACAGSICSGPEIMTGITFLEIPYKNNLNTVIGSTYSAVYTQIYNGTGFSPGDSPADQPLIQGSPASDVLPGQQADGAWLVKELARETSGTGLMQCPVGGCAPTNS